MRSSVCPASRAHLYPHLYGEFCVRHQRDNNCVMQCFCGYQFRLGPRSTLRRWSPGLETTSELNAITRPPSASRRWCQGLTTIWPQFWTSPRLLQSFENSLRRPGRTLHTARRQVVKPAVHRREAGWGRVNSLVCSVVSKPWLSRHKAGRGQMAHCGMCSALANSSISFAADAENP